MEQPSYEVLCTKCREAAKDQLQWRCARCGAPLSVEVRIPFDRRKTLESDYSMWRYRGMLPFVGERLISMGEGLTPLVSLDHGNTLHKLDYMMPTGSFKDRGSSAMMSTLRGKIGGREKRLIEDSSGNAGASVAAYAAKAGLECSVYAPKRVSESKARQIMAYGARLFKVSGSREDVARAAQRAKGIYVSHIWNPFFIEGIKTLAYELAEQMSWNSPHHIFLPVSAGVLLLGVIKGFKEMNLTGTVQNLPHIVAVQPLNVSPLYHAFNGRNYVPKKQPRTIADALISTNPPRLEQMVSSLRDVKGDCVAVKEGEIIQATRELAKRGFYVEPSSATVYAAWKRLAGKITSESRVVLVLTGSGLKTTAA